MSDNRKARLSHKQRLFVLEYTRCWNATQAALRAGYSPRSAGAIGSENLKKPEIVDAIQARIRELAMGADEVLIRLAEQARAEYSAFMTPDGRVQLSALIASGKAHLIKGIKYSPSGEPVVEFYDAQAALVHLGRHHGLFVDKTALTDPTGEHEYSGLSDEKRAELIAALLERARARAAGQAAPPDRPADE